MEQVDNLEGIRFADQESQSNYCSAIGGQLRDKVILVTGPSGSGKTRLARYMLPFLVGNHSKEYMPIHSLIAQVLRFQENFTYLWLDDAPAWIGDNPAKSIEVLLSQTVMGDPLIFPIVISGIETIVPKRWSLAVIRLAPNIPKVIIPPVTAPQSSQGQKRCGGGITHD